MKKKTVIMIILCIWIVFMAVGFALFQERLTITGTSHVDSRWEIKITNISTSDIVGDATEKTAPSYTDTTARLKVSLINPTDSITYNIKIKNLGTLDARIKKIAITEGTSDAIEFEVQCKIGNNNFETCDETHFKNQVLAPNAEQTLKIKITFKAGYVGDPSSANKTSTVKVVTDYVQNFEESGTQILPPEDRAYSIGDVIEFAGSNWYVIEDSGYSKDYVTLMKKTVLTKTELGNYSHENKDVMFYYWGEGCHRAVHGYSLVDYSGCGGHNDYAGSKVKEFLEGTYINTLGEANLKEVDGYKIRLITTDELINNLGWTSGTETSAETDGNNVPTWVYQNFGGYRNDQNGYWTMTKRINTANQIWRIYYRPAANYYSSIIGGVQYADDVSVRPVINLYKSAIE